MLKDAKKAQAQEQQWNQLQQSSEKRKRWNRTMPRPADLKHNSHVPGWKSERKENAPTWKTLFYWSAGLNVLMIGVVLLGR